MIICLNRQMFRHLIPLKPVVFTQSHSYKYLVRQYNMLSYQLYSQPKLYHWRRKGILQDPYNMVHIFYMC